MADNVPTALADPPIPLLGGEDWQMSFGERAALEGLLCQLRPRLSIEVGSAAGGSLRRIARHSARVHSFDLAPPASDVAALPNVTLHTGDSRFLLPAWLDRAPRDIDFALIDGDHTTGGVYADLMAVLCAPAAAHAVVLLHDAGNETVRDGIATAIGIEAADPRQHVAYSDLDFLPGYIFARGEFAGQRWGGFALIVLGDASSAQTQDLYQPS